MSKDVLTTTQAAQLLGVSVRTAQLWIESGALTSWKTPGGHRRVYRADVLAFIARTNTTSAIASTLVVLLASPGRLRSYNALLRQVGAATVVAHSNVHTAMFAIGSQLPAAVVVDLSDAVPERVAFLQQLAAIAALGRTQLVAVGPAAARIGGNSRIQVVPARKLVATLRAVFGDPELPDAQQDTLSYPTPANERQRLAALERAALVGTAPEEAFDRLTWLASRTLQMPVALMTLLTPTQQWFKSRVGLEITETPRSWAFCNHTILQKEIFAIEDLARAAPFNANPAVVGGPRFRFYAGAPVVDPDGFALGSLCVMDYEPRRLDAGQDSTLLALAGLASDEIRLRATNRQLRWALDSLNRKSAH